MQIFSSRELKDSNYYDYVHFITCHTYTSCVVSTNYHNGFQPLISNGIFLIFLLSFFYKFFLWNKARNEEESVRFISFHMTYHGFKLLFLFSRLSSRFLLNHGIEKFPFWGTHEREICVVLMVGVKWMKKGILFYVYVFSCPFVLSNTNK